MVGVMAVCFRKTHVSTVFFSAPDPVAGHSQAMPLPETPGYSQASLALSVLGSLLFSPRSCLYSILLVPS